MENNKTNSLWNKVSSKLTNIGNWIITASTSHKIIASLVSIISGYIVGFIIMLIVNPSQALQGFYFLTVGSLTININQYLVYAISNAAPIILTGLSIGFAFRTGLFNIGASGQVIVGGMVSILIALKVPMPAPYHFIVCVLGGTLAGAIWGGIVGALKAFFNVNEVVSSIMMNYIGGYLVNYLVSLPGVAGPTSHTNYIPKSAVTPTWGLDKIFPLSYFNIFIFIAIAIAIVMYFVLNKTTLGYQLKAVGFNKDASRTAGIAYRSSIFISMTIAGALSGLAGAAIYLSPSLVRLSKTFTLLPTGFDGISVALLGMSHPIATIFTGIFISYINKAGELLQQTSYAIEVTDIVISVIIYFSALSAFILGFLGSHLGKKKKEAEKETINNVIPEAKKQEGGDE